MENDSEQTLRLLAYIREKYGTEPDSPWKKDPGSRVLRHTDSKKWYALIMRIPEDRLGDTFSKKRINVLNLKTDPLMSGSLRMQKGIYPAYHMNKTEWITVRLDDTLDDGDIFPLVDMSYVLTDRRKCSLGAARCTEWLIPANPRYYDIEKAIAASPDKVFDWKQSNNIRAGDTVYIYLAAPVSAIAYKCRAVETDIPYSYSDENISMSRIMRLKLIMRYDTPADSEKNGLGRVIGRELMKEYGVTAVRGPRSMPSPLIQEIDMIYGKNGR
ncbi:MAG: MmcQ/YjbR family DNA-binding protein [Oscillospiraceae bacterium]|nr:MmcQ/YjbR family DNA-binding protein [Oscillospiraceae bacterium]